MAGWPARPSPVTRTQTAAQARMHKRSRMESQSRSFEDAFGHLQEAIERLEQGGLPLAEALAVFEQSVRLAGDCHRILDQAELRLTRLVEEQVGELDEPDEA